MSIQLYKAGSTHNIRGIECEMGTFKVSQLHAMLDAGWVNCPKKLTDSGTVAPTKAEADTNNSGKLRSSEVREAAKQAGIEGFDTKRIATLKTALGYDD